MPSRTNEPVKPKGPTGVIGWNQLLSQAIRQAEKIGDPRAAGLKKAMRDNAAEPTLRKFGILSETDIQREFPG